MKKREYEYIGERAPTITARQNAAFLQLLQAAMLSSLERSALLTHAQYLCCVRALENNGATESYAD